MRRMLLLLAVLLGAIPAFAGDVGQTRVQQSPWDMEALTKCSTQQAASGSPTTLTITPAGGSFIYLRMYEITAYAAGALTAAATPNTATFTGLGNIQPIHSMATKAPAAPTTDTG